MRVDPCFMWNSQRPSKAVVPKWGMQCIGVLHRGGRHSGPQNRKDGKKTKQCIKMRTAMYKLTFFFLIVIHEVIQCFPYSLRGHWCQLISEYIYFSKKLKSHNMFVNGCLIYICEELRRLLISIQSISFIKNYNFDIDILLFVWFK